MSDSTMWIVIVEADGGNMPSTYYRRLERYALRSRGDKTQSVLSRRDGGRGGIIFQEGAIICASESLARQIAHLARRSFGEMKDFDGTPTVSIGRLAIETNFVMTPEDARVMGRIENTLSKRGRKGEPQIWTISCVECGHVTQEETITPINCPNCSGFLISARLGGLRLYADPGGDVVEAWKRLRFATGKFEPTEPTADGQLPPATVTLETDVQPIVDGLAASPVLTKIRQMGREMAFEFLDGIFISGAYRSRESRLALRVQAAMTFFVRGGQPGDIRLTDTWSEGVAPDLLDAAAKVGVDTAVTWMLT